MVLSIGRTRPRWQTSAEGGDAAPPAGRAAWLAERGGVRWALTAELNGAWPGFGRDGGLRAGAKVRFTERYLLVDEERPHGFALPFAAIVDAGRVGREAAAGAALLIRYRDGDDVRSFLIEPRGVRLFRRDQGLDGAADALEAAGLRVSPFDLAPTLAVDWTRARAFADENVIWSGVASAPLDLWGEQAPADVWLSTRSLLWSRPGAPNLLRLPLDAIADATPFAGERGCGVTMGAIDAAGARADLTIRFDRHSMRDRNARERGAFLVGLRSRGIRVADEPAPLRPWLDGVWSRPREAAEAATALAVDDAVATPATIDSPAPDLDAPAPNWPTWTAPDAAARPAAELPIAAGDEAAAAEGLAAAMRPVGERGLPRVAAFEAGALRVLAAIRGGERAAGRLLIGTSLAGALSELDEAAAADALDRAEAAIRRERLVALNEAAIRLRALAELRAGGYVGDGDFDRKRRTILEPLAERLFPQA